MKVLNPSPELEARQFDPTKPVTTRDGRKARIICSDRKTFNGQLLLATLITESNGTEGLYAHGMDGRYSTNNRTSHDLVNTPVKEEGFQVLTRHGISMGTCGTLQQAKECKVKIGLELSGHILKQTFVDNVLVSVELVE